MAKSAAGPSEIHMCRCSFYEIYNEQVYDLTVGEGEKVALNVREATGKGIFLEGLSEEEVCVCLFVCLFVFFCSCFFDLCHTDGRRFFSRHTRWVAILFAFFKTRFYLFQRTAVPRGGARLLRI